jgi:hypothetical protein
MMESSDFGMAALRVPQLSVSPLQKLPFDPSVLKVPPPK